MATLFETNFETGTIGAAMADGSSGFDLAVGATAKPSYIAGLRGSVAMQAATSGTGEQRSMTKIFSGLRDTVYIRAYMQMPTAVTFYALQVQTAGAIRAILRLNADGSVRCRSDAATLGGADVGAGALNGSTTTRVEWMITPTLQRCKLFTGANQHGATANYDTGDISWTPAGTFDRINVGVVSSTANVTLKLDDVAIDDTTWVGPVATDTAGGSASNTSPAAWETVNLTGTGSAVGTWTQISGVTQALTGSGANVSFVARPSGTPGATATCVFRYTVGTATADVTVTTASGTLFFGSAASPKAARLSYP